MPQINSVRGLSSIKTISKCEVNPTRSFQDIAFTSNCGRMDGRTDAQGHCIIRPVFRQTYKNKEICEHINYNQVISINQQTDNPVTQEKESTTNITELISFIYKLFPMIFYVDL